MMEEMSFCSENEWLQNQEGAWDDTQLKNDNSVKNGGADISSYENWQVCNFCSLICHLCPTPW